MSNFPERLRTARLKMRMKQQELAEIVGFSVQTISRYENGEREPVASDLQKLASILRTSTAYLLGETDDPSPPHAAPQHSNIVITVGDVRMEFPQGTPGEVIGKVVESAKKGEKG
jgi:transcriptional regulator with XRE-family HTH domain